MIKVGERLRQYTYGALLTECDVALMIVADQQLIYEIDGRKRDGKVVNGGTRLGMMEV